MKEKSVLGGDYHQAFHDLLRPRGIIVDKAAKLETGQRDELCMGYFFSEETHDQGGEVGSADNGEAENDYCEELYPFFRELREVLAATGFSIVKLYKLVPPGLNWDWYAIHVACKQSRF